MESALSIAIGLIFIYLLLSLVCSAMNEVVAWALSLRARIMKRTLTTLLTDVSKKVDSDQLFSHPLIRNLGPRPDYLAARTFSSALVDLVGRASNGAATLAQFKASLEDLKDKSDVARAVNALLDDAVIDLHSAKKRIEDWFDEAMTRATGVYKQYVHGIVLGMSVLLVAFTNADTFMIGNALWHDEALRNSVVAAAEQYMKTSTTARTTPDAAGAIEDITAIKREVEKLSLPLGWKRCERETDDPRCYPRSSGGWAMKVIGLLVTIFAVSLGAPFWFDLLNRAIKLRASGDPPKSEKTTEEKPKQP